MKSILMYCTAILIVFLSSCDTSTTLEYTVIFESNGGTVIESLSVESGTTISEPDPPLYEGYTFLGWFSDSTFNNSYDFSNPIIEDVILYAKWVTDIVTLSDILLEGPSLTPTIFAPNIISTVENVEFAGTFSPAYDYFFYTARPEGSTNRIYYTKLVDGVWTEPSLSPISEDVSESEPFITNNGQTMYFHSRRANPNQFSIYKSDFIDGEWQEPILAEQGLNDVFVMYITIANSGNIYFTSIDENGAPGIYVINYVNGMYEAPVYTTIEGAHPYIAPDESFMLFDKGYGNSDYIYITVNNNGTWSTPEKLDDSVNPSNTINICPMMTPDGKYFFFSRFINGKSDIYWVDGLYLSEYLQ